MASLDEKAKSVGGVVGGQTLVAEMKLLKEMQEHCGKFMFPSLFLNFYNVYVICFLSRNWDFALIDIWFY